MFYTEASMAVYADDSTIHASASTLDQVNNMLQHELMSTCEWVVENSLKLNALKTKVFKIGCKTCFKHVTVQTTSRTSE